VIEGIEVYGFLEKSAKYPVLDVRSPSEYIQGHLPGAINIPLFNDSERALIGSLYVQKGKEMAVIKGLDICLPKSSSFVKKARQLAKGKRILIYCWRGGMRSATIAQVFEKGGYKVFILTGGYKSYRRFVRAELSKKARIVVLGGYTGSGKTEILSAIGKRGEQTIDLEKLASHRGSVFGALGQPPQPTNEQFENNFFVQWKGMDFSKPIWIEDESRMIGKITLPDPLFDQISNGILIQMKMPLSLRIERLVREYSCFDPAKLAEAICKLHQRIGGTHTRDAIQALENRKYDIVSAIVLSHYDKAYQFAIERRKNKTIYSIEINQSDGELNAEKILSFFKTSI